MRSHWRLSFAAACLALLSCFVGGSRAETLERAAKETLTAVEMNHGDLLRFRLRDGRVFTLELVDTDAAILEKVTPGGIVYQFRAHVRADGQPMVLHRYVCCQECFYEPYVIDGVRIWLDTVKDVFDLIPIRYPRLGNLQCLPRKQARLAVQETALRICPDRLRPWIEGDRGSLDVAECYNGDDCYLGPYLGQACHVGMDINHAKGSLLFAPLDFDTQAYFNSLKMGHNNNRWRGIRRWANGDVWALQTHHLIDLLVPPQAPVKAGTRYATTAGVHVGSHEHTHFEFKIGRAREPAATTNGEGANGEASSIAEPIDFDDQSPQAQAQPEVLHLDPWIVFWQIFEDRRVRSQRVRAAMQPVGPAQTGQAVTFSAGGSWAGAKGDRLDCHWTFGDGGYFHGRHARHVFARPGVYPVSLVVDDGHERARCTQHIAVSGENMETPVLTLTARDEPAFHIRPQQALDTYGQPVRMIPHQMSIIARPSCPVPSPRSMRLTNIGGGVLPTAAAPAIAYRRGGGWLIVDLGGRGNDQEVIVMVKAEGLEPGVYDALVSVICPGTTGSPQSFHVRLQLPREPPGTDVTIDDRDPGFFATPYFWVGHRFCRCPRDRRGYGGFYLTNGGRDAPGQWARFTPDLRAGRYRVSLCGETPFPADTEFKVWVRSAEREGTYRMKPRQSRVIGEFKFDEGTDGFVEIRAGGSQGLVIADAVRFERLSPPAGPAGRTEP